MQLVIIIGLQGSGKSTFARTFFADTHRYVSKDRMRNTRNKNRRQECLITEALSQGHSVVVDNTNPNAEVRAPLIALGKQFHAEVVGYYLQSRVEECILRNRQREGKARVPDVAIYVTAKKLQPPSYAEGFDQLYYVRINPAGGFRVSSWKG